MHPSTNPKGSRMSTMIDQKDRDGPTSRLQGHDAKEEILIDGDVCAIVVRADYDQSGIQFFTPSTFSQQLAAMCYAPGKVIGAHTHNPVRAKYSTRRKHCSFVKASCRSISLIESSNIVRGVSSAPET